MAVSFTGRPKAEALEFALNMVCVTKPPFVGVEAGAGAGAGVGDGLDVGGGVDVGGWDWAELEVTLNGAVVAGATLPPLTLSV